MGEKFWPRRVETAAGVLFAASALLVLLDLIVRSPSAKQAQVLGGLGIGLTALAALMLFTRWATRRPSFRLVPPLVVVAATTAAVQAGGIVEADTGIIGLTLVASFVLVYIGFVSPPGVALAAAPLVLVLLVLGRQSDPDRFTLALPIVAVPALAVLAELVSYLTNRSAMVSNRNDRRLAELDRLSSELSRFRRPSSLEEAGLQIVDAALECFNAQRATVILRDETGVLQTITQGPPVAAALESDIAKLISDAVNGTDPIMVATARHGQILLIPLPTDEGTPAGAVLMHPVDSEDADFVIDMAYLFQNSVSIAIGHLYVIDQLNRRSLIDPLTDLGNRRHADRLLRSLAPGDAVVLLDLDGFKQVNDTLGHPAGDEVLRLLSKHLKSTLRDSDTSARLGGDEFLIVARQAFADPLTVAERVVIGWAELNEQTTLSAGVALHMTDATSAETLDLADRALMTAKKVGKNRALLANPTHEVDGPTPDSEPAAEN
ncbi:MAG: GGDEF domain-containing protein [Acidimicrobiales bacterium]|nr:GGDEF domain-containing protein [Acidimicrobiales bacterium]